MPTQDQGIPLYHRPQDRGYRLVELPADLEALLTSSQPTQVPLTLASSDTSALLVTPHKTYSLRQKNTSNALILLAPHAPADGAAAPELGMAAIATVQETVELDEVKEEPVASSAKKTPPAKGKWHERFGRER